MCDLHNTQRRVFKIPVLYFGLQLYECYFQLVRTYCLVICNYFVICRPIYLESLCLFAALVNLVSSSSSII